MQVSIKVSTSWDYIFRWKWSNMTKVPKIGGWWYFCNIYIYIYIYILYIYIYIIRKECHSCFWVICDAKHKGMRSIFQKKGKKVWKFGQKCTKFENIVKKSSVVCATFTHVKQLEYLEFNHFRWMWSDVPKVIQNNKLDFLHKGRFQ